LSSKLQTDELIVLDKFELPQIKTKDFVAVLSSLKLSNALIIIEEKNENILLSSRNVPHIKVLQSDGLNVYDILKYKTLILLEPVIKNIEGRLAA
jgi:large subunit ribosomal protein L4